MAIPLTRRSRWPMSWWIWVAYWVGLFILTHIPSGGTTSLPIRHFDKFIHFSFFLVLVLLGGYHRHASGRAQSAASLLCWLAVYVAYAGFDEWLQAYVHRCRSLSDWLWDAVGIASATLILALAQRRARLSVPGAG